MKQILFQLRNKHLILPALFFACIAVSPAQDQPPAPTPEPSHGTVLLHRGQDDDAEAKKVEAPKEDPNATVPDEVRSALVFDAYDLDVHLIPAQSQIAVRAQLSVTNVSAQPLTKIALQISSSLNWESFAIQSGEQLVPAAFVQHLLDTDTDHTGQAQEAIVTLPAPLRPGDNIRLAALYSGQIVQSANRLERIGAPTEQAASADWDKILPELTALRGYGNVLWYPTASPPAFLGDEAKLFKAVGQTKLRQAKATIQLRLTVEYTGDAPDAATFCGQRQPLTIIRENSNEPTALAPGVATAEFPAQPIGFRTPSLFVTDRAASATESGLIQAVTDHYDALPSYSAAAEKIKPLLMEWLGLDPLTSLQVIDHEGQPFEDQALLVERLHAADVATLAPSLTHSLTHVWFRSSHIWLDEGLPQFMSLLWMEHEQGRDAAVQQLQHAANTLALAEPAVQKTADSPAAESSEGQSLILASDDVYYRSKAAAVLWMLRSIVGDEALKHALERYRHSGKRDQDPKEFQHVLEQTSQKDLGWFFDDWVYRDRGLPDLKIVNVTTHQLPAQGSKAGGWLVAVEVQNDGGAVAEVPVTVRSGTLTATERLRVAGFSRAATRIVFGGTPTEVLVNDGSVPEVGQSLHSRQMMESSK